MSKRSRYLLKTHEFSDMPLRFQVFIDSMTESYFNLDDIENENLLNDSKNDFFFQIAIVHSDSKDIEARRVIGVLQYLGEVGGIYSSLFIIATAINFILQGKN